MRRPPGNKEACNPGDARWDNVPPMLRSTATVLTVLPLRHSGASLQVVLLLWQTEPSVLCRDVNAEHCTLSPGHKQCHQAPLQCYIHQCSGATSAPHWCSIPPRLPTKPVLSHLSHQDSHRFAALLSNAKHHRSELCPMIRTRGLEHSALSIASVALNGEGSF